MVHIRSSNRAARTADGEHDRLAIPSGSKYVRLTLDALQQQRHLLHNHRKRRGNMLVKRSSE